MKVRFDCLACHQRQAVRIMRLMTEDKNLQEKVLRHIMEYLSKTNWDTDPMTMTEGMYAVINRLTGIADPYKELKYQSNKEVLQLYPELQEFIQHSEDPLLTACKLAVAGNIMDFSTREHFNIRETIQHVLKTDFVINHYDRFKASLSKASSILLFADNAGEIVCDKLLLETIMEHSPIQAITVVVKGRSILNDATMDDVRQVGLTEYSNIQFLTVDGNNNGSGRSVWMHPQAEKLIRDHDVAISKGQANYEMMNDLQDLYCLLIAKCDVVGEVSGTYNGALIFTYSEKS